MAPSVQHPDGAPEGKAINKSSHHCKDPNKVTFLVTGFGPFQERFPVNPSYEIASRLPDLLPATCPQRASIRIIRYGTPIKVAYNEVRELIPKLHESCAGTVDIVLHLGMASGRKSYCIERYGHRDGYSQNKDVDGKMPHHDEGKTVFGDCPVTMTTSLDYDSVLLKWQCNLLDIPAGNPGHDADARPSEDAGHYLCDYIYFNSLAYTGRRSGKMEGGGVDARPVLFLHVPAESDGDMIDRGCAVTTALIRAMADSFEQRGEAQKEAV